jgi:hypothetical protein
MELDNVVFVDTVSKDQVARYWSLLDVSIIHLKRTELFTTVIPSKLFECMAMGVPVLHGVEGESAEIVRREGAGLTFTPEDADELARQLLTLAGDCEQLKALGEAGRAGSARYDRAALAGDMLAVLQGVAAKGKA